MPAPFAHVSGDRARPPTVFLHGFGGHHGVWDHVRAGIGPDAHTIAYDLPGHGNSLSLRDALSARKAAAAILADLHERTSDPIRLVGHSMGGAVATLMAIAEPARIAWLTLLAPGGFGESINEAALKQFAAACTAQELELALRPMCGRNHHPRPGDLEALAEVRRLPGQSELLAELVAVIARGGRQGVIPRTAIGALPMPVTVVWGDEDRVLSPSHADDLPPQFRLLRVPGAGHMLPEERTDLVAELVLRDLG
jgi:pyruvate dehydrogenase E2 component (dihydrolipoamide acetyltransferase)